MYRATRTSVASDCDLFEPETNDLSYGASNGADFVDIDGFLSLPVGDHTHNGVIEGGGDVQPASSEQETIRKIWQAQKNQAEIFALELQLKKQAQEMLLQEIHADLGLQIDASKNLDELMALATPLQGDSSMLDNGKRLRDVTDDPVASAEAILARVRMANKQARTESASTVQSARDSDLVDPSDDVAPSESGAMLSNLGASGEVVKRGPAAFFRNVFSLWTLELPPNVVVDGTRVYIDPEIGYSGKARRFRRLPANDEQAVIVSVTVCLPDGSPVTSQCNDCYEYFHRLNTLKTNPHQRKHILLVKNNNVMMVQKGCITIRSKTLCASNHHSAEHFVFRITLFNEKGDEICKGSTAVRVKQWKKGGVPIPDCLIDMHKV